MGVQRVTITWSHELQDIVDSHGGELRSHVVRRALKALGKGNKVIAAPVTDEQRVERIREVLRAPRKVPGVLVCLGCGKPTQEVSQYCLGCGVPKGRIGPI